MRRIILTILLQTCWFYMCFSQDINAVEAILAFTGVSTPEELDEYEFERLYTLINSPLNINVNHVNKFVINGLLTTYQAASLADYRIRHGDVMSYSELSVLDGFNEDFVRKIRPFISLNGGKVGASGQEGYQNETVIRLGVKHSFQNSTDEFGYGLKYSMDSSSGILARVGLSSSYSSKFAYPDTFSGTIGYYFQQLPVSLILGDFNARFGQGLALWNGMSMSGLTTPSTMMRRPSGFSPSSSFTGSQAMTGVATSMLLRHFTLNISVAFPGIKTFRTFSVMPSLNIVWNHRHGQLGITHYLDFDRSVTDMKTSVDMAWCLRGTDVFSEISYDWSSMILAALAGVSIPLGDAFRLGTMLRMYPPSYNASRSGAQRSASRCSNEYSCTLAGEFISPDRIHSATLSADMAYFPESMSNVNVRDGQLKLNLKWVWSRKKWILKAQLSERMRTWGEPFKTDLRADLSLSLSRWNLNLRANVLHCVNLSYLGYVESVYKAETLTACMRSGIFFVDEWENRIYVYERDAPGGFNVPAMYGRGFWSAAYIGFKPARWIKLYMRAAVTLYPFMPPEKKKPGRAELKLQCAFTF